MGGLERVKLREFSWSRDLEKALIAGAVVAGALLIAVLPRLLPGSEDLEEDPYPRSAEHAEV